MGNHQRRDRARWHRTFHARPFPRGTSGGPPTRARDARPVTGAEHNGLTLAPVSTNSQFTAQHCYGTLPIMIPRGVHFLSLLGLALVAVSSISCGQTQGVCLQGNTCQLMKEGPCGESGGVFHPLKSGDSGNDNDPNSYKATCSDWGFNESRGSYGWEKK